MSALAGCVKLPGLAVFCLWIISSAVPSSAASGKSYYAVKSRSCGVCAMDPANKTLQAKSNVHCSSLCEKDDECKGFGVKQNSICDLYQFIPQSLHVLPNCKYLQPQGGAPIFITENVAGYEQICVSTLATDEDISTPLLSISSWILMQRRVYGGSLTFRQYWAEYRDGFGSPTGNDNYWLGLEKVYQLAQLASLELRFEIKRTNGAWYSAEYDVVSLTDEVSKYRLTLSAYTGNAGDAFVNPPNSFHASNGQKFSCPGSDNDAYSTGECGGNLGWWFKRCSVSSINVDGNSNGIWTSGSVTYNVIASHMLVKVI